MVVAKGVEAEDSRSVVPLAGDQSAVDIAQVVVRLASAALGRPAPGSDRPVFGSVVVVSSELNCFLDDPWVDLNGRALPLG